MNKEQNRLNDLLKMITSDEHKDTEIVREGERAREG